MHIYITTWHNHKRVSHTAPPISLSLVLVVKKKDRSTIQHQMDSSDRVPLCLPILRSSSILHEVIPLFVTRKRKGDITAWKACGHAYGKSTHWFRCAIQLYAREYNTWLVRAYHQTKFRCCCLETYDAVAQYLHTHQLGFGFLISHNIDHLPCERCFAVALAPLFSWGLEFSCIWTVVRALLQRLEKLTKEDFVWQNETSRD